MSDQKVLGASDQKVLGASVASEERFQKHVDSPRAQRAKKNETLNYSFKTRAFETLVYCVSKTDWLDLRFYSLLCVHANTFRENLWGHTCEKSCKFARATRRNTQSVQVHLHTNRKNALRRHSLRRGRSARSTLEPGLSANFKERKPKAKAKPPAPPANVVPHRRKPKAKLVKMKNLQVECFIDNAWHPATIKDGQTFNFLKGYKYTIVYHKDKYQETRVYDETMRIPA